MQCSTAAFRINTGTSATYAKAQIGSNCPEDYIGIEGELHSALFWLDKCLLQSQPFSKEKLEVGIFFSLKYILCIESFWLSHSHFILPFLCFKASSQSGTGNSNNVYCGGFLNDHPAATTDAKIRGMCIF